MSRLLTAVSSLRATFVLLLLLVAVILLDYPADGASSPWFVLILAALSLNLIAAIVSNVSFRTQPALLAFHVCLLAVLFTLAASVLYHFDGHLELVEGEAFDARNVEVVSTGLWRAPSMQTIHFTQGDIYVDYGPELVRRTTHSEILLPATDDADSVTEVGDRLSLDIGGFRFLTSFNKGFSLLLQWVKTDGQSVLGAVNFPSYPEYEWKQANDWTSPAGDALRLELLLPDKAFRGGPWRLQSDAQAYALSIRIPDGTTRILQQGEAIELRGGSLVLQELRMWMGYRVDAYPLLPWVFSSAMLAVLALALHFREKFRSRATRGNKRAQRRYAHAGLH